MTLLAASSSPRRRAPRWGLLGFVLALHLLAFQGLRGLGLRLPELGAPEPVMTAIVMPREERVELRSSPVPRPALVAPRIEPSTVDIVVPVEAVSITLPEVAAAPAPVEVAAVVAPVAQQAAGALRVDIAEIDYLRAPVPRYPPAARRLRLQGVVQLLVAVDVQGRVSAAIVQDSSGHAELDSAARQAVFDARFRPYRVDGQPRAVEVLVPVQFMLDTRTASLR